MDASPRIKLSAVTIRTLVFALAYPVWVYASMDLIIRAGWSKYSWPGLMAFLGVAAVGCAGAWLAVRPVRIRWFRWPWWSYAPLGLGYATKAWFLAEWRPWPQVVAGLLFYLVAVSLMEEFIFRGCVEEGLSSLGPWTAAVVAGLFFGLSHAPLSILHGSAAMTTILSSLGGGVLGQLAYRWLRDKGGLALPVLVHGLLDFLGAR